MVKIRTRSKNLWPYSELGFCGQNPIFANMAVVRTRKYGLIPANPHAVVAWQTAARTCRDQICPSFFLPETGKLANLVASSAVTTMQILP